MGGRDGFRWIKNQKRRGFKSDHSFSRKACILISGNKHTKYFALKWSACFVILLYDKELKYKIPVQKITFRLTIGMLHTIRKHHDH